MGGFLLRKLVSRRENGDSFDKLLSTNGENYHIENNEQQDEEINLNGAEMSSPQPTKHLTNTEQRLDKDLTAKKPKKKYVRPLPSYMNIKQMQQLLDHLTPYPDRHLLVSLLWVTGLRITEALSITPADCDFQKQEIRVQWQKSRIARERIVSVIPKVMGGLYEVCVHTPSDERVFDFSRSWAYEFIKTAQKELGFKLRKYGPHSIRHAFATHLKGSGKALEEIMYALGHADLRPTQIYAHVDGTEHKKATDGVDF